ncbi:hypothetical protein EJ06DRAFT_534446 [Trichodelitschia bisporula]|uniref:Uncharacterized protein n=1 Tax=Trichodelitschia bisporula TaxID=703511 RepID=A0A6G1HJD0_9PEZI|nr:hypothetical protein EJ06DRAFT_534446 [Trichodelitschia bisporula]
MPTRPVPNPPQHSIRHPFACHPVPRYHQNRKTKTPYKRTMNTSPLQPSPRQNTTQRSLPSNPS